MSRKNTVCNDIRVTSLLIDLHRYHISVDILINDGGSGQNKNISVELSSSLPPFVFLPSAPLCIIWYIFYEIKVMQFFLQIFHKS